MSTQALKPGWKMVKFGKVKVTPLTPALGRLIGWKDCSSRKRCAP